MSEKQQKLVYSIIEFLNQSIQDGTVKADDQESLEVAIQCIGEAFGVDPSNQEQVQKLSVKPATLQSIFDVYIKTRDKVSSAQSSSPASASTSKPNVPSAEDKAQAEKCKQTGNAQMSSKEYDAAIESYNKAVALDPTNPVYYSNRAAAHSSKGDHLAAVGDAEKAISVDSKFVKAYHRLGHAQYSLGDFKAAASAFERGLKLEPSNASLKTGLQNARARIDSDNSDDTVSGTRSGGASGAGGPGLGGMADMLRNLGGSGGPGGGGMPDLASMMNNPQLMAMAQQMAANGGLASLMQNPGVANMMSRVQSGNMPSMEEIMADPSLRQLAEQFGAAAGRR
ncbi:Small glutamine-rich tetratricopeptide repeat-containing protein 2 [Psilocybe cubensis]|uniref:SGTA homodimerisation domain-containing protein n=2 Tax=Psilocybe cubensis TaxID=181762 RepID=A0A8H8CQX4_PSICU|nr:Small glutamine-rich tetratricopeptide repeat-containing protein 2 [Psilocybe cubensis]KAH9487049.1 Small glutamine-rich tetratricopeptide repeat-containing protein 2 [Psilocybe cubensis]